MRTPLDYRPDDRKDADIMCKAGHWRAEGITFPIWFNGPLLPWSVEEDHTQRLWVGGNVGRYLAPGVT
jgi:hypothetical protein